jgi:hypothetical protein
MKVETHIVDKQLVEEMKLTSFDPISTHGWGISLSAIEHQGKTLYRPDITMYVYKVEDPDKMTPLYMMLESVYQNKTEAILRTYFAGLRILGVRLMPDIIVYSSNAVIEKINLVDVLSENEEFSDFFSDDQSMLDITKKTIH